MSHLTPVPSDPDELRAWLLTARGWRMQDGGSVDRWSARDAAVRIVEAVADPMERRRRHERAPWVRVVASSIVVRA